MRCKHCGAKNDRTADICIDCGSHLEPETFPIRKISTLPIVAFIALCVLMVIGYFAGEDKKEVLVDTWVAAINQNDSTELFTVFPQISFDGIETTEEFASDHLDKMRADLISEFGSDFRMSATVKRTMAMRELNEDLLIEIYKDIGVKVKHARILEIEVTIEGSKRSETQTLKINILRIDKDWYFDIFDPHFV